VIAWLPNLLTGVVIAFVGVYAGELVQGIVARVASGRGDTETADFLGRGAYMLVLAIALTMAAEQVGLPTHLVNSILLLAVAAVAFGVAAAFAMGSRTAFHHLVARHYLQRMFRPGDRLTIGEVGGELVRFGAVSAVLKTEDGELVVPCAELLEGTVHLRRKAD
jgi:small-conductance mechanosensitive channel